MSERQQDQPLPADPVLENAAMIRLLVSIVENAPVPIYLKDPDGTYLFSNAVASRLVGAAPGRTDFDLFPESLANEFRAEDIEAMHADSPVESTSVIEIDGQDRSYTKVKFPIYGAEGEVMGVCGIALDITDSLSDQRVRAKEEEHATAAKPFERLLATLSPQETKVAELLILGFSDHQIATTLHLEPNTVRHHVSHVLKKLRKQSRTQAVIEMLRYGKRD